MGVKPSLMRAYIFRAVFELDFYDPRITPMETIKAKLHDFITVVLKKGGAE